MDRLRWAAVGLACTAATAIGSTFTFLLLTAPIVRPLDVWTRALLVDAGLTMAAVGLFLAAERPRLSLHAVGWGVVAASAAWTLVDNAGFYLRWAPEDSFLVLPSAVYQLAYLGAAAGAVWWLLSSDAGGAAAALTIRISLAVQVLMVLSFLLMLFLGVASGPGSSRTYVGAAGLLYLARIAATVFTVVFLAPPRPLAIRTVPPAGPPIYVPFQR